MQTAGKPHQPAYQRPAEQPAHDGANGAGIGDGILNMQPEIGAHNAEPGERDVAQQLMRQANRDLNQRDKQPRFTHHPGDHQKYAHLLEQ